MPQDPCLRCGQPSQIRVTRGDGRIDNMCAACLRADSGSDAFRFFALLTNPHKVARTSALPNLEPYVQCGSCGLTFGEFSAGGLTGCPECYTAFRAAILPALEILHGGSPAIRQ